MHPISLDDASDDDADHAVDFGEETIAGN